MNNKIKNGIFITLSFFLIFEISKSNNVSEASIAATKNDIDY